MDMAQAAEVNLRWLLRPVAPLLAVHERLIELDEGDAVNAKLTEELGGAPATRTLSMKTVVSAVPVPTKLSVWLALEATNLAV